ncbi:MAG: RNA methyltransferase [Alphaproteobacteria bacterium]
MAGTDKSRSDEAADYLAGKGTPPIVILVNPQLGENIGACARAMLNFGLTEMRIVNPRDGWPNEKALSASSGAVEVIENAKLFDTVEEAVGDLNHVYATTARQRELIKPILFPGAAAAEIKALDQASNGAAKTGVMFGRERWGLENEEISLADSIITYPVNPAFSSLNLGQAVLLFAYEWFAGGDERFVVEMPETRAGRAEKKDLINLFGHLEEALTTSGFLYPPPKVPGMVRNLRAIFTRADLMHHEVLTLRGVISSLVRSGTANHQRRPNKDD